MRFDSYPLEHYLHILYDGFMTLQSMAEFILLRSPCQGHVSSCHHFASIRHHYLHLIFWRLLWNFCANLELQYVYSFAGIMYVRSSTKTFHWHDRHDLTKKHDIMDYLFFSSNWLQLKKSSTLKQKVKKYMLAQIFCQLKNMSAMHNSCVWLAEIDKNIISQWFVNLI